MATDDNYIIDLLEVLDRRLFEYDLTTDDITEIYIANSRTIKNK